MSNQIETISGNILDTVTGGSAAQEIAREHLAHRWGMTGGVVTFGHDAQTLTQNPLWGGDPITRNYSYKTLPGGGIRAWTY